MREQLTLSCPANKMLGPPSARWTLALQIDMDVAMYPPTQKPCSRRFNPWLDTIAQSVYDLHAAFH